MRATRSSSRGSRQSPPARCLVNARSEWKWPLQTAQWTIGSSCTMPPTTTATFAGGNVAIPDDGTFAKVTSKFLSAGSYAIAATANVQINMGGSGNPTVRDTVCELRGTNGGFIGGGRDRRVIPTAEIITSSVSMNGGAQVPAGGGEVGLYCRFQEGGSFSRTADGQMMIIRLDGFF